MSEHAWVCLTVSCLGVKAAVDFLDSSLRVRALSEIALSLWGVFAVPSLGRVRGVCGVVGLVLVLRTHVLRGCHSSLWA